MRTVVHTASILDGEPPNLAGTLAHEGSHFRLFSDYGMAALAITFADQLASSKRNHSRHIVLVTPASQRGTCWTSHELLLILGIAFFSGLLDAV